MLTGLTLPSQVATNGHLCSVDDAMTLNALLRATQSRNTPITFAAPDVRAGERRSLGTLSDQAGVSVAKEGRGIRAQHSTALAGLLRRLVAVFRALMRSAVASREML